VSAALETSKARYSPTRYFSFTFTMILGNRANQNTLHHHAR
jgi:hypothetical protein